MAEKKKFIDIEVPILNDSLEALGSAKELENKTIHIDLSRKMKGKGVVLTLQILRDDNKLYGVPKKFTLISSYIKRIMRKRTDYVEDSFKTVSREGAEVVVKPFMITRQKVSRAVRRNLRNTAKDGLVNYMKEKDYIEICENLFNGSLQKEILPKLKKVYPLAFFDLRIFETKDIEKLGLKSLVRESLDAEMDIIENTSDGEIEEETEYLEENTDDDENDEEQIEEVKEVEKKTKKTKKKEE